jgi:hypothetical protein
MANLYSKWRPVSLHLPAAFAWLTARAPFRLLAQAGNLSAFALHAPLYWPQQAAMPPIALSLRRCLRCRLRYCAIFILTSN